MILKLATKLTMLRSDRGEGPVPYVIIVAIIAAAAAAIATTIVAVANGWVDRIEDVG